MKKLVLTFISVFAVSFIFAQGVENWGYQDIYGNINTSSIEQDGVWNEGYQTVDYGDENQLGIYQYGFYNISDQDVIDGDLNEVYSEQFGDINYAKQLVLDGDENDLYVFQSYFDNSAYQFVYYGDENTLTSIQYGEENTSFQRVWPGDYNELIVYQDGDLNYAWQDVAGSSNFGIADQLGVGNSSYQNIFGDDNEAYDLQIGDGNINNQYISGNSNYATTTQLGDVNQAFQTIFGDDNSASTLQEGYNPIGYGQLSVINIGASYFLSNNNTVDHWQQGVYNQAFSTVFGDYNTAYVHQLGGKMGTMASMNYASTYQYGYGNDAEILQGVWDFPLFSSCGWVPTQAKPGYGNDAYITQYGVGNTATIQQADDFEGSWTWFNTASIYQDGWYNDAEIYQNGDVNDFATTQVGDGNYALSFAHGLENDVFVSQYGTSNYSVVFVGLDNLTGVGGPNSTSYEYTGNEVSIYQDGYANLSNAFIVGNDNDVDVEQYGVMNRAGVPFTDNCYTAWGEAGIRIDGDMNTGSVMQYGTMNLADMQIIGNSNTATILQY